MEDKVQVFETPDSAKTFDELNNELEVKAYAPNAGVDIKPSELSFAQIAHHYNSLATTKAAQFNYITDEQSDRRQTDRLEQLRKELTNIKAAAAAELDSDPQLATDLSALFSRVETLKTRRDGGVVPASVPHFKKLDISQRPHPHAENAIKFEVTLNALSENVRLRQLAQRVREAEYIIGDWKTSRSVNESISEFVGRLRFCNSSVLEKLENQARHLNTDLDILVTSKVKVTDDANIASSISDLHNDTYAALSKLVELPSMVERLRVSASVHEQYLEFDKSLIELERGTERLGESSAELLKISSQLRAGIEQGLSVVSANIEYLLIK